MEFKYRSELYKKMVGVQIRERMSLRALQKGFFVTNLCIQFRREKCVQ